MKCGDVNCVWYCNITRMKDGFTARCKRLGSDHNCYNDVNFDNYHADARWVASVIETKLRAHLTRRSSHIIDEIW